MLNVNSVKTLRAFDTSKLVYKLLQNILNEVILVLLKKMNEKNNLKNQQNF